MQFNPARTELFVGCGDDNTVAVYEIATEKLLRRYRNIAHPRPSISTPTAGISTSRTKTIRSERSGHPNRRNRRPLSTGPNRRSAGHKGRKPRSSPQKSRTSSMPSSQRRKVIKEIVGRRNAAAPFALSPDQKGSRCPPNCRTVDIINTVDKLEATGKVEFRLRAMRREQIIPVDLQITKDGTKAYVALGRANHVAVVDVKKREVLDYILVGNGPGDCGSLPTRPSSMSPTACPTTSRSSTRKQTRC